MAFIRYKNKHYATVPGDKANIIWQIMNGELTGTPQQMDYIKRINRIYLNPATAPLSYKIDRMKVLQVEQGTQVVEVGNRWYDK